MAASAWTFYNSFLVEKNNGTQDLDTHAYKIALFKSTSNCATATLSTYVSLTNEVANLYGYTTGGLDLTEALQDLTGSVKWDFTNDPQWTASGGSITARYAVIYNFTTGGLVCYSLLDTTPADVTATDGNNFTIYAHTNGVFTEAPA